MPELRKDPITGRWIIFNVEHQNGPQDFPVEPRAKTSKLCPFCPGNESMTPLEISSYKKEGRWQVRVVPNRFPALKIEETTDKMAIGIYDQIGGFGAHEVIIDTPDHHRELADLTDDEAALLFKVFKDRCLDLRKDPRFKYLLLFKNSGAAAGASLEHSHSQLIGLPIVPVRVSGELKGAAGYFEFKGRCVYCDMLDQERGDQTLTIAENSSMICLSPFVPRFPYETWIMPKNHLAAFDLMDESLLKDAALILRDLLKRYQKVLKDPPYNFMIHTVPIGSRDEESYHWHIEIIPKLMQTAGFEWGTGFYVNPVTPEKASEDLKKVF